MPFTFGHTHVSTSKACVRTSLSMKPRGTNELGAWPSEGHTRTLVSTCLEVCGVGTKVASAGRVCSCDLRPMPQPWST